MLNNFQIIGCHISIKVHYVLSHFYKFHANLGDLSEEQGIKIMEERYRGRPTYDG